MAAGLAKSFPVLLVTRMGVGITEAGCSPPMASLLSDYFSAERRGRAMSIFTLGGVAGIGAGMLLGGIVGQHYGWRTAMFVAGLPGIVLAIVFYLTVREPPRGHSDGLEQTAGTPRPSLPEVLKTLFSKPTFRWLIVGASFLNVVALGRGVWEPVFLMRIYGLEQATAGITYFLISPVPSMIGAVAGGLLADYLGRRDQRWCMWLPAAAMLATFPLTAAFLLWPVSSTLFGLGLPVGFLFSVAGSLAGGMASPATIATGQNLSPASMRAMTHALWTMASNLVGMGLGPLMVGVLSDQFTADFGSESIRYALLAVSAVAVLAAIAFYIGARRVREDLA
jgi:MFS family permease